MVLWTKWDYILISIRDRPVLMKACLLESQTAGKDADINYI